MVQRATSTGAALRHTPGDVLSFTFLSPSVGQWSGEAGMAGGAGLFPFSFSTGVLPARRK
ncbi:MAG: hypothetical protein ABSE77_11545, partial [Acidimicrobiales bacterium]